MKSKTDSPDAATASAWIDDCDFPLGPEFDVFLSFSSDTRFNFADSLYHSLVRAGIRVFREDEGSGMGERTGENLLRALESFKMYMPIFSKSYASNAWCLRELTFMMDRTIEANDKAILPIFYEVDPRDVKLKPKLYVDPLEEHEMRYGSDEVLRWKNSLMTVAGFKGWETKGKGHGEIIQAILDLVPTRPPSVNVSRDFSLGAEFDVLLSFRGPDTRLNFTDSLYHSLVRAGIRVFRDEEEIRKSEEIGGELSDAIKSCKIYLPIFSRQYASSSWCLRELTHMMECLRESNEKLLVPIFYDVSTTDVKLRTDLYTKHLHMHKKKFGLGHVLTWKQALIAAASFKGWDLNNRGHGEIIGAIVDWVSAKLIKRRRNLPKHLVGIHDHVEAIARLLTEGSGDAHYLVIYGMGGIGKTTLASAVFNRISNQFQDCSFLLDVREVVERGRIIDLQKQLLSEILRGRSLEMFYSVNDGINIMSERFRDKKVLLVLDDVHSQDQLSKLAGEGNWFGPGSKIIITTRNINFLAIQKEDEKFKFYEMTGLDPNHALQLFSKHAFGKDTPPDDLDDISCKITNKIGGLPLALEVIGSSLYCKSKSFWKGTLKKLNLMPKQEVFNKLKISYDLLDDHQKEIFLDIACFFIGKERLYPYYMWKACGYSPENDVLVISRMSLIKIVEDDKLWMHDQLRDLARAIIRCDNVNNHGKWSRLWEPKVAFNVVRTKQGTNKIVALRLTGLSEEQNFTSEEFSKLQNLRFLELEGGNLVGDFENLLSKLTWLSWSRCPSELKATNLCLEKLAVLELSESNITEDWTGWGSCLMSEDLKVVQVTQCPSLKRTPDFSKCSNLKRLVLQDCTTLLVVDGSLSKLERLKHLQISMTVLPERDVTFTPINLATLSRLRTLEITCPETQSLVGLPSGLEELTLYDVKSPIDRSLFANSTNLSSLSLCKCLLSEVVFDDVLGQQLEKLHSLEVRDSELLERLSIAGLNGLRWLGVFGCPRLMDFQVVEELKSLEALFIHECSSIRLLPQLSELRNLRRLHLKNCRLQNLSDLRLPDTCHLMIEGCGAFPSFGGAYKKWKDSQSGRY